MSVATVAHSTVKSAWLDVSSCSLILQSRYWGEPVVSRCYAPIDCVPGYKYHRLLQAVDLIAYQSDSVTLPIGWSSRYLGKSRTLGNFQSTEHRTSLSWNPERNLKTHCTFPSAIIEISLAKICLSGHMSTNRRRNACSATIVDDSINLSISAENVAVRLASYARPGQLEYCGDGI